MTKSEALALFDNNQSELARALGITRGYVSQWPEDLEQKWSDRIVGAAIRLGRIIPTVTLNKAPAPQVADPVEH